MISDLAQSYAADAAAMLSGASAPIGRDTLAAVMERTLRLAHDIDTKCAGAIPERLSDSIAETLDALSAAIAASEQQS